MPKSKKWPGLESQKIVDCRLPFSLWSEINSMREKGVEILPLLQGQLKNFKQLKEDFIGDSLRDMLTQFDPTPPHVPPLPSSNGIQITDEFQAALEVMESGTTCFITGGAGTGKSTLVKYFLGHTSKNVGLVAPTGVAALNVGGVTIHSFFGFNPKMIYPPKTEPCKIPRKAAVIRGIDTLIIDEVSMVRADMLDRIDVGLRKTRYCDELFGGVQVIFVGDLFQLPPVVIDRKPANGLSQKEILEKWGYKTEYFFGANVIEKNPLTIIELKHIFRQEGDLKFSSLLNKIRVGMATENDLAVLDKARAKKLDDCDCDVVVLVPTNKMADSINAKALAKLEGELITICADIQGDFSGGDCLAPATLEIKLGAFVMILANDPSEKKEYVNGSTGIVCALAENYITVEIDGIDCDVERYTWENIGYIWDSQTQTLKAEKLGTFSQFPIKLAKGITIHKSQGQNIDRAMVDVGNGYVQKGAIYTALSRLRTLEGLSLTTTILKKHIKVNPRVLEFMSRVKNGP